MANAASVVVTSSASTSALPMTSVRSRVTGHHHAPLVRVAVP